MMGMGCLVLRTRQFADFLKKKISDFVTTDG